MRYASAFPAALCAALCVAAAPARAQSPVAIEGVDENARKALLELLPERDRPTSLFEAERIAEEAAARARVWLRSEGYYAAEVTPEASDSPPRARLLLTPGTRFHFAPPRFSFEGAPPDELAADAVRAALAQVSEGAPGARRRCA